MASFCYSRWQVSCGTTTELYFSETEKQGYGEEGMIHICLVERSEFGASIAFYVERAMCGSTWAGFVMTSYVVFF